MKNKKLFVNIILLIISLLFSIILAEIFLRTVMHVHPLDTMPDEDLIFKLAPNHEVVFQRSEYKTIIKTNSLGMRDKEYSLKKPENTFRIIVIGDSMTEGEQVDIENVYTEILENKLQEIYPEKNIEVLNAGVRGYFPVQELAYLKKEGLKLSPDLVIIQYFLGNDIIKASKSTIHEIINDKLVLKKIYIHPIKRAFSYLMRKSGLAKYTYQLVKESDFVLNTLKKIKLSEGVTKFEANQDSLEKIRPGLVPYLKTSKNMDIWDYSLVIINEFKKIGDDKQIPLIFLIIPKKEEIDLGEREQELALYGLDESEVDYEQPSKKINQMLEKLNIEYVDLKPYLIELNQNNSFYFDIDGHLNEKGQYLTAQVLFNQIKSLIKQGEIEWKN